MAHIVVAHIVMAYTYGPYLQASDDIPLSVTSTDTTRCLRTPDTRADTEPVRAPHIFAVARPDGRSHSRSNDNADGASYRQTDAAANAAAYPYADQPQYRNPLTRTDCHADEEPDSGTDK